MAQEAEHITQRKQWMEEKLEAFVEGKMTEEEFEQDSEAEAEADEVTVMSLLIWYQCIPLYFHLYITFSLSQIPQPCNMPL